jgi:hypothetical protein
LITKASKRYDAARWKTRGASSAISSAQPSSQ